MRTALFAATLALGLAACDNPNLAEKFSKKEQPAIPSTAEKSAAQQLDKEVAKTDALGQSPEDAAISAKVKQALAKDPQGAGAKIDVKTSNGVVALYGTVDDEAEREQTLKMVATLDGVRAVENHLVIVKGS